MGTYTDFTGAIRITPCLKEPLAGRFRQFLGIRHMKRDVKIACQGERMACQCPYSEQKHCFVFSDTAIMIAQETGCEDDWQE